MGAHVVVLGAGYAGTAAVKSLEGHLGAEDSVTWVADVDYHLVLHELHRAIRNPDVEKHVTIPVEDIAGSDTTFLRAKVRGFDADQQVIDLGDGSSLGYDYLVVAIGSETAFYGIPGLREHAYPLKRREHASTIHGAIDAAASSASIGDPARVVVGGAGLSGIQVAGEVAALRDERRAPIEVTLLEGLQDVLPSHDPALRRAVARHLDAVDVTVETDQFVSEVDDESVHVEDGDAYPYDVLVWTGGIRGRDAASQGSVRTADRSDRIEAGQDFRTSDEYVFAVGDCALVDQPGDEPAPPTAQAAWQAADVVGENVARAIRGEDLRNWRYRDMGTVVSIGNRAVAHDLSWHGIDAPVTTFDGVSARVAKKAVGAKWLRRVAGTRRALAAWRHL